MRVSGSQMHRVGREKMNGSVSLEDRTRENFPLAFASVNSDKNLTSWCLEAGKEL